MDKNEFMNTCKAMGGKYSSEHGLLEPDVGYDTLHEKEAFKQWCSFGHLKNVPKDLTVFKAPGIIELQSKTFSPTAKPKFEQGFFQEKYDLKEKEMCFKSTIPTFSNDLLPGVLNFCIVTYPTHGTTSAWIGFPTWNKPED